MIVSLEVFDRVLSVRSLERGLAKSGFTMREYVDAVN